MIEVGEYVSRTEYIKKYNSNVGYALHVQNSIKKDDYARLSTGKIVKIIGIRENNVNKKAIYYGIYDTDWFDSSATENFSADITDLIEVGDIVEIYDVLFEGVIYIWNEKMLKTVKEDVINGIKIRRILTKEQYEANCYKVKEEIC